MSLLAKLRDRQLLVDRELPGKRSYMDVGTFYVTADYTLTISNTILSGTGNGWGSCRFIRNICVVSATTFYRVIA